MARTKKLIQRLKSKPQDFTWQELVTLLSQLGFDQVQGGGSRVKFYHQRRDCLIQLHKPHPARILKHYAIKEVLDTLQRGRLL